MSGNWGSELTELIPLALVVALSPLSIIPAVLVLHTPRPRPTGLAFLAGWVVGLAALTAIFVEVSSLAGGLGNKPPSWASWVRIVDRRGADRVRRVPLVDPQALGAHSALDAEHEQAHPAPGCAVRCGTRRGESQGVIHLRGSGFGHRHGRAG